MKATAATMPQAPILVAANASRVTFGAIYAVMVRRRRCIIMGMVAERLCDLLFITKDDEVDRHTGAAMVR